MDPNLFHLDYERTFEVFLAIIFLSLVVERFLAPIVESRPFKARFDKKGVKELLALIVGALICIFWDFDAVSIVVVKEKTTIWGEIITGGVIAGGSKGSIRIFKDWLGIMSKVEREEQELKKAGKEGESKNKKGEEKRWEFGFGTAICILDIRN